MKHGKVLSLGVDVVTQGRGVASAQTSAVFWDLGGMELRNRFSGSGAIFGAIAHDKVPYHGQFLQDSRLFGRPDPPNVSIYMDRAVINPKLHRLAGNEVKRPGWVVLGFEGWKENRWEVVT